MLPRAGRQDVSEMDAAVKAALQGTGARTRTPGGMLEEEEDYVIPETSFSCQGKFEGGFYGDPEADCKVFHVCVHERKKSFVCPKQTLFHQQYLICDWSNKVDCSTTKDNYTVNARVARRVETCQDVGTLWTGSPADLKTFNSKWVG